MTHPKHKAAPKSKPRKGTSEKRELPIGLRSAKLVRDNRKSAVIVPVAERPWIAEVNPGDSIRMPIAVKGAGYLNTKVVKACFHATLASIPACEHGHVPGQFDVDVDWHTVLLKSAWGSNRPAPLGEMDERAREGWVVIGFVPTWFPREWQAHARKCRAQSEDERISRPSGDAEHDAPV